jgi:hypothetical protein
MNKVICDTASTCKEPCFHKTPHFRTDREPINLMHGRGCQNNPRPECWGQCHEIENKKE